MARKDKIVLSPFSGRNSVLPLLSGCQVGSRVVIVFSSWKGISTGTCLAGCSKHPKIAKYRPSRFHENDAYIEVRQIQLVISASQLQIRRYPYVKI